jgi:hypothetical protein
MNQTMSLVQDSQVPVGQGGSRFKSKPVFDSRRELLQGTGRL